METKQPEFEVLAPRSEESTDLKKAVAQRTLHSEAEKILKIPSEEKK